MDGFVKSIVVCDDHILVTIHDKDKAKRISFKEIERSDLSSLGGSKPCGFHGCTVFCLL